MDDIKYKVDFHLGCKVEIEGGDENEEYEVLFFDNKNNKLIHRGIIKSGYWTKPNIRYFVDWKVQILKNPEAKFRKNIMRLQRPLLRARCRNLPVKNSMLWRVWRRAFLS